MIFHRQGSGVAIPYGAYDINRGEGFVNVGIIVKNLRFLTYPINVRAV